MKLLLEAVYEPVFSRDSHGFRPNRSCHTALESVLKGWTGSKWIISVDIKSFYDNINHKKMLAIVGKRIDDKRFIRLLSQLLTAGYMEEWTFHCTYSGTPQGGTVSPILSNIYLNELDEYIKGMRKTFEYKGRRKMNSAYSKLTHQISGLERKARSLGKDCPDFVWVKIESLRHERDKLKAGDPMDERFRRLKYCRYADDFILGVTGRKEDAIRVEKEVHEFIKNELDLQISEEKSKLQHLSKGHIFLGHHLKVRTGKRVVKAWRQGQRKEKAEGQLALLDTGPDRPRIRSKFRSVVERVELRVPPEKIEAFCKKKGYGRYWNAYPQSRPNLIRRSDLEIVNTYNAELRGFANFYALCPTVKSELSKLNYLSLFSLMKTLGHKHRESKAKWFKRMRIGTDYVYKYEINGRPRKVRVFQLKHLDVKRIDWKSVDTVPNTSMFTLGRTELLRRLSAEKCEYCGGTDNIEVHHVRKLKDLKGKQLWEKVMISMKRKQIVLCRKCHRQLHSGRLPQVVSIDR